MKNLFITIIAILNLSTLTFAQEKTNTAASQSKSELQASKESGTYTFVLPEGLSAEDAVKNAMYYIHYFSVEYNEKLHTAEIEMISNDAKSRNVIKRYLTACGVRYVKVDSETLSLDEFFNRYIL